MDLSTSSVRVLGQLSCKKLSLAKTLLLGAASVVAGDMSPDGAVAGNPARIIEKIKDIVCPLGFHR
jgi:serine acetyltransferase